LYLLQAQDRVTEIRDTEGHLLAMVADGRGGKDEARSMVLPVSRRQI
jgi:hypothetical protein